MLYTLRLHWSIVFVYMYNEALKHDKYLQQFWWKSLTGSKVSDDFIELAIRLVSAPASSASIERIFSTFAHVHNKVRNRPWGPLDPKIWGGGIDERVRFIIRIIT